MESEKKHPPLLKVCKCVYHLMNTKRDEKKISGATLTDTEFRQIRPFCKSALPCMIKNKGRTEEKDDYGVAAISRLLEITGLFCKRAL